MKDLIACVQEKKDDNVVRTVELRKKEFSDLGKGRSSEIFKEMCFCFLTANFSAEGGIRIQKAIGNGFLNLPEKELAKKLKELGHRYPEARAGYIVEARKFKDSIKEILSKFDNQKEMRKWVVANVKGLGYKEASHFLRNIGYDDLAIIDFHIIDLLVKYGLIERPKTLTKNRYIEIEKVLQGIAGEMGMTLSELDLYLWYCETGKVLK